MSNEPVRHELFSQLIPLPGGLRHPPRGEKLCARLIYGYSLPLLQGAAFTGRRF